MAVLMKNANGELVSIASNGDKWSVYKNENAARDALRHGELSEGNIVGIVDSIFTVGAAGMVVPFAGAVAPDGWLICDGREISRTVYAGLFSVIGTTYGSGDGSTTFNVPDLREAMPRGAGQSGNNYNADTNPTGIHEHNVLALGEFQDDALQKITGSSGWGLLTDRVTTGGYPSGAFTDGGAPRKRSWSASNDDEVRRLNFDSSRVARSSTTTHDKTVGMNYIIKY